MYYIYLHMKQIRITDAAHKILSEIIKQAKLDEVQPRPSFTSLVHELIMEKYSESMGKIDGENFILDIKKGDE